MVKAYKNLHNHHRHHERLAVDIVGIAAAVVNVGIAAVVNVGMWVVHDIAVVEVFHLTVLDNRLADNLCQEKLLR